MPYAISRSSATKVNLPASMRASQALQVREMAARLRQKSGDIGMLDNDLQEVRTFVESLCEEYIAEIVPHFSEKSPQKKWPE